MVSKDREDEIITKAFPKQKKEGDPTPRAGKQRWYQAIAERKSEGRYLPYLKDSSPFISSHINCFRGIYKHILLLFVDIS